MLPERKELESLMGRKRELEQQVFAKEGEDRAALVEACSEMACIVGDFEELDSKKGKVEHGAFATKLKFSSKVRRKSKDIGKFERMLVSEFDSRHISLGHARKMAEVLKLLKEGKIQKAAGAAEGIYRMLEAEEKLVETEGKIAERMEQLKKAANIERGRIAKLLEIELL